MFSFENWDLMVVFIVQLLGHVWLFETPWTAAHQASGPSPSPGGLVVLWNKLRSDITVPLRVNVIFTFAHILSCCCHATVLSKQLLPSQRLVHPLEASQLRELPLFPVWTDDPRVSSKRHMGEISSYFSLRLHMQISRSWGRLCCTWRAACWEPTSQHRGK